MAVFVASRLSGNDSMVMPDRLEIDDVTGDVTFFKCTPVGYVKSVLLRSNIASSHIVSSLLFADIVIESTGGKTITAQGFWKKDAREAMRLLG